MKDPRVDKLSRLLTTYSCEIKAGENVLIEYEGTPALPLVKQLIKDIYSLGAWPYVNQTDSTVLREMLLSAGENQFRFINECAMMQMKGMDAFIGVRSYDNISELSDVPSDKLNLFDTMSAPVLEERVNNKKWVILAYPNSSIAQRAAMSQEAFENFFFNVCTFDYRKMSVAMDALVSLMEKTDKVRLVGPGTDLSFSIKGIPAIKCDGKYNIPDGEVYTAPVRNSINGCIAYNTPSEYQGFTYDHVCFDIKDGKIINATSNDSKRINELLDTDEGGRYFGEFAIGVNPYIMNPMTDILFDEKICGSFHLTPGMAYDDADNGNKSAVHWDLVMIQRPEYGGGEIWFDDVLIRKDGIFLLDELLPLNPDNLK